MLYYNIYYKEYGDQQNVSQVYTSFPSSTQTGYPPTQEPLASGGWGGTSPTLGFPQAGGTAQPTAPNAAMGWGQPQMGGALPPGVSPEMYAELQSKIRNEQEVMKEHLEAQNNMKMQHIHNHFSTMINNSNAMEKSLDGAAKNTMDLANSIGDLAPKPKGSEDSTSSTSSSSDTTSTTTSTTDTSIDMSKMNPMNFQKGMEQHMQYMPNMQVSPTTSFGGTSVTPQSFAGHFGAATGTATTSPHFATTQGMTPQMVHVY